MDLISGNTNWIFLLPSSTNAEQRHIFDIAFGVHVLLSRKVPLDNIVLLVDGCSDVLLHSTFSEMQVSVPNDVYTTSHYYDLLKNNLHENVVIFVTGHGSIDGIDSVFPIKPYDFYNVVFVGERNNKDKFYFLIDFKFDVSSPRTVCNNIDDQDIRKKYSFTKAYIQQNDIDIRVYDTAFFVFKNKDFEIVKNSWMRRKLNSPKNVAVKQCDFEIVFEQNEK